MGINPFQETWSASRNNQARRNISSPMPGISFPQPNISGLIQTENAGLISSSDTTPRTSAGLPTFEGLGVTQERQIAGMAKSGLIPGKRNPNVADDTNINAKKGEYIFRDDVVAAMGPKFFEDLQNEIIKSHGLPSLTSGPKQHHQPDSMGRMDTPNLGKDIPGKLTGAPIYFDSLFDDPTIQDQKLKSIFDNAPANITPVTIAPPKP